MSRVIRLFQAQSITRGGSATVLTARSALAKNAWLVVGLFFAHHRVWGSFLHSLAEPLVCWLAAASEPYSAVEQARLRAWSGSSVCLRCVCLHLPHLHALHALVIVFEVEILFNVACWLAVSCSVCRRADARRMIVVESPGPSPQLLCPDEGEIRTCEKRHLAQGRNISKRGNISSEALGESLQLMLDVVTSTSFNGFASW